MVAAVLFSGPPPYPFLFFLTPFLPHRSPSQAPGFPLPPLTSPSAPLYAPWKPHSPHSAPGPPLHPKFPLRIPFPPHRIPIRWGSPIKAAVLRTHPPHCPPSPSPPSLLQRLMRRLRCERSKLFMTSSHITYIPSQVLFVCLFLAFPLRLILTSSDGKREGGKSLSRCVFHSAGAAHDGILSSCRLKP